MATDGKSATRRPLVLAIAEAGLRSVLAASLALNDQLPIICTEYLDPALGAALRAAAILIIEEALILSAPEQWIETLRAQSWGGALIIIVEYMPNGINASDGLALVDRAYAVSAVTTLVNDWQTNGTKLVNRPD